MRRSFKTLNTIDDTYIIQSSGRINLYLNSVNLLTQGIILFAQKLE